MAQELTSQVTVNEVLISQLAREVARDILPSDAILKKFRLDTRTYTKVLDLPFFQKRLEEEVALWNGSDAASIRTRIAAKAAVTLEESLLEAYDLVHDKNQPLSGKVEMLKFIARLASMEHGAVGQDDGDGKVIINISFGNNQVSFEKERVIDAVPIPVEEATP